MLWESYCFSGQVLLSIAFYNCNLSLTTPADRVYLITAFALEPHYIDLRAVMLWLYFKVQHQPISTICDGNDEQSFKFDFLFVSVV
jgi:hypothetical protein